MLSRDFQFLAVPHLPGLPSAREYDVNFGFTFILPGLAAASIGYKNVKYDTADASYKRNAKGM
jgi:hypothetical protein